MNLNKNQIYKISKFLHNLIPTDDKIIVFESFLGRQYSDNPRAIYEYMQKNYPEYKCYWSVDPKHLNKFKHLNLNIIKQNTLKWLYVMMRAKYWISNSRIPLWVSKPQNTVYIQTWHGTPLKKLALDMDNINPLWKDPHLYKANFVKEANRWDYLISPNNYSTEIFKRSFNFKNKIIESGYPRNDFLKNNNDPVYINKIKDKLGIPQDKKIVLYAPTWRDNFTFNLPFSITNLKKELGDDYFIIFRLHYLVRKTSELFGHEDFIKNVSNYNEISDLYLISDILITDYSSVFFDYAVLQRPMIFYCYDLDDYKNILRGFYFDFENNAPGPIVKTTDELIKVIKTKSNYKVSKDFFDYFISLEDGNSTKRVVKEVFNF